MEANEPGGFCRTYGVELLCSTEPELDQVRLSAALAGRLPGAECIGGGDHAVSFAHPEHRTHCVDGEVAPQTVLARSDRRCEPHSFGSAIEQSWAFPDAGAAVDRARHSVLVTDMLAAGLPHRERLRLLQTAVRSALDVVACEAIHWGPTQQIVDPDAFVRAVDEHGLDFPLPGALNVRFYNITAYGDRPNDAGDMIMDTLGLGALGLRDLQCHFRELDANAVSHHLYNVAHYVYDHAPEFDNGHTVQGLDPIEPWTIRIEDSLLEPTRAVLDLDPGERYAAGVRA